jgi:hypothetical protein
MRASLVILVALLSFASRAADEYVIHTFEKLTLNELFFSEGANYADFNQDGKMDVVAGPFWYEGPDFKKKHQYQATANPVDKKGYSNNFFAFTYDFNGDKFPDILIYGFPGKEATWYENPKGQDSQWTPHKIFDVVDNESPQFGDVDGDGKPDLVCTTAGQMGYATADWTDSAKPWTFHPISAKGGWQKFTHGLGFGDVNGDGRLDMLDSSGWWEQPADKTQLWIQHAQKFGNGGAQMYVYDVNGDGKNDVITSIVAHGYGLAWYEQVRADDKISFKEHIILPADGKAKDKFGVQFSQLHAVDLIDMDGDGVRDIVTGKRHWAHGPGGDPEPQAAPVLYWFKTVRGKDGVDFTPYMIDGDSGVGTQVVAADVTGDGLGDVVVGSKRGVFVLVHKATKASKEEWEKAQPKPVEAAPAPK